MKKTIKAKIVGELYKFGGKHPKILARGFMKKSTEADREKFRKWMHKMAQKYNVPYSEVVSLVG